MTTPAPNDVAAGDQLSLQAPSPDEPGNPQRLRDRRLLIGLLLFFTVLYLPFAGNYGMWDPWETHYSEVARQMRMRSDYISLWWPGSPQDRNEFWSKPVLTFWLIALGMTAARLETGSGPALPGSGDPGLHDGEMAVGWTAEWAARIPMLLCTIACLYAVWELMRRLVGHRAAFWSVVVLATSTQFAFIARQAITDMPFVAPMTVALCYAALALLLPAQSVEAEVERRSHTLGPVTLSWPHTPIFYALLAVIGLTIVPQLVLISIQLQAVIPFGRYIVRTIGLVPMLPWIAALVAYLVLAARARNRRQLYLHLSFLMCGIATLAKGPAGLGLPVLVVLFYLLLEGELPRRLVPPGSLAPGWWRSPMGLGRAVWLFITRSPLELGLGLLVFVAVSFPWYHAMLVRHGMGFWNEFIGDNYVQRAAGRHGDRGTFEYYLQQIGYGIFPWVGVAAPALWHGIRQVGRGDTRSRLTGFALSWFLVILAIVTLVNTKFHHYILPALPALAILSGLFLDALLERPSRSRALGVLGLGLPLVMLAGRDLAMYPARLSWLFDYDYVNAPNGGRAWPMEPAYDYRLRIGIFVAVATLATLWLGISAWRRARQETASQVPSGTEPAFALRSTGALLGLAGITLATFIAAELWQPAFVDGPKPLGDGWILVGASTAIVLVLLCRSWLLQHTGPARRSALAVVGLGIFACLWCGWILDRHLTDLSPHWSQKHVIASYYRLRKGPDEPLIAWQMYWRGETFYCKNSIYDHRLKADDKTVFLGDRNQEKLQTYFRTHAGRRVFFIVERSRFETLRTLLPEVARPTLKKVDETNNKVFLAVASI